jgi:hypothetical protein
MTLVVTKFLLFAISVEIIFLFYGQEIFSIFFSSTKPTLGFFKNKIIHLFSSYYNSYAFVILLCDTVMGTGIAGRGVLILFRI